MIGVYRITSTVTNRVYIGSAIDVYKRLLPHKALLQSGKHANTHLQRSWAKHGPGAFVFEPLVECSVETRKEREQRFIDAYIEHDLPLYNIRPSAESREGFRYQMTEESRKKMNVSQTGKQLSVVTKRRISEARLGTHISETTRERMSKAQTGRVVSEESRLKMIATKTGQPWSAARRLSYERTWLKCG